MFLLLVTVVVSFFFFFFLLLLLDPKEVSGVHGTAIQSQTCDYSSHPLEDSRAVETNAAAGQTCFLDMGAAYVQNSSSSNGFNFLVFGLRNDCHYVFCVDFSQRSEP